MRPAPVTASVKATSTPERRRWWALGAAGLAGVLSVLAGHPGHGWLAWIALVPVFLALPAASRALTIGVGIVYAAVLGVGSVLPWLVPAAAAYLGISTWRAVEFTLPFLPLLCGAHGAMLGILLLARPRAVGPWGVLWYGAVWVVWESLRTVLFPYYPAAVLGLSQSDALRVLQVASVLGIAGVTFILVAFNAGLAALLQRSPASPGRRAAAAATGLAVTLTAWGWGTLRLQTGEDARADGPSILAVDIKAMRQEASTLEAYLAASRDSVSTAPELLIWPESALPTDIERDRAAWTELRTFTAGRDVPLLAGGPGSSLRSGDKLTVFNSVHLLRPNGGLQSYHKRLPVPFAERWPSILGDPPAGLTSLDVGRDLPVFPLGRSAFGVLICFEIMDGAAARTLTREGARFIVNATNDAWFPGSPRAPHVPWAPVRAAETGLPVVRAANAGVSAIFDRFGREVATSRWNGTAAVLSATVPQAGPTLYARTGDVFTEACVAAAVGGLALMVARRRRFPPTGSTGDRPTPGRGRA